MLSLRLVAALLLSASYVLAQAQYGSIGGGVTDTTGAVIPGVAVSVVNAETGQITTGVTGVDGRYLIPQLLPGAYNIRVEHGSFKGLNVTGVSLNIGQNAVQDLTLEIGSIAESISVSSRSQL